MVITVKDTTLLKIDFNNSASVFCDNKYLFAVLSNSFSFSILSS